MRGSEEHDSDTVRDVTRGHKPTEFMQEERLPVSNYDLARKTGPHRAYQVNQTMNNLYGMNPS